jgi:hypothetical protein
VSVGWKEDDLDVKRCEVSKVTGMQEHKISPVLKADGKSASDVWNEINTYATNYNKQLATC